MHVALSATHAWANCGNLLAAASASSSSFKLISSLVAWCTFETFLSGASSRTMSSQAIMTAVQQASLTRMQTFEGTPELLVVIFRLLEPKDICIAGSVCRAWRAVAWDDAVWLALCRRSKFGLLNETKSRKRTPSSWRRVLTQRIVAVDSMFSSVFAHSQLAERSHYMVGVEIHFCPNQEVRASIALPSQLIFSSLEELASAATFGSERNDLFFDTEITTHDSINFELGCFAVSAFLLRKSDDKILQLMDQANCSEWDTDSTMAQKCLAESRCFHIVIDAFVYDRIDKFGPCLCQNESCAVEACLYRVSGLRICISDQEPPEDATYSIRSVDAFLNATEQPECSLRWAQ